MNRTTIPCPRCDHDYSDLLDLMRGEGSGFVVGHRVHCRSCEHVWTDISRVLERAEPVVPWGAPRLVEEPR